MNSNGEPFIDPSEIRRRAMQRVTQLTGGDAFTYQLRVREDETYYVGPQATDDVADFVLSCDGERVMGGGVAHRRTSEGWSLRAPLAVHTNRFASLSEDRAVDSLRSSEAWRRFYEPYEVTDHLRALFYREGEMIGYLAALRRGGERFDRRAQEELNQLVPLIIEDLRLAASTEAALTGARTMHLILDQERHVLYAGEAARAWLTPRRRELLRAMRHHPARRVIDRMYVSETPMVSEPRGLLYVSLDSMGPAHASDVNRLSKTQRQIAELARKGLTNREIARTMHLSLSTVKYHLTRVFARLGVGSRIELATES